MSEPCLGYARKTVELEVNYLEDLIAAAERQSSEGQQRLATGLAAFWQVLRRSQCPQLIRSGTRIDAKRTLRDFLRHGGTLVQLHYHDKLKERRLVVLIDCSESALLRPGLFVLIDAILGVDPRVVVLGFDSEVFPLQRSSVQGLHHTLSNRCQNAVQQGKRFLDMLDLGLMLHLARRFMPATTRSYLLIVSDLFLQRETMPSADLERMQQALLAYRKTWLIDTWPSGLPFTESEDGTVTCSARSLLELIEREDGAHLKQLAWRRAETRSVWQLPASVLARLALIGEQIVLEGRRFTPYLRDLGFVSSEQAAPTSRLIHVPHSSCQDFAVIFRETRPL